MKRAATLVAALALAACAPSSKATYIPPCKTNHDCASGELCYVDGCGSAVDFAVRVTPNSNAYVVQDFNPVSVAMSRMDLVLQNYAVVEGDALERLQGQAVPAPYLLGFTLEAVGTSNVIPGLEFPQPVSQSVALGKSRFSLTVPPGTWSLRATPLPPDPMPSRETPSDPLVPPVFAEKAVGSNETLDPGFVFAGDSLNEIQGNLVVKFGTPWPQDHKWFMRFQALDPVSQAPLSQPAVFLATSVFHVFTAARGAPVLLRVSPDPKLNLDSVLCPTKDFRSDDLGAFGPFEMGDFGFGAGVEVTITVQDPAGSPVASADVRAEGRVVGGGTLSVNGKSDVNGKVTLRLLPSDPGDTVKAAAKYTLTVHPTFDSANASAVYSLVLGNDAQALSITCPAKVTLSGRVVDGGNAALANVPVLVEGNPAAANPGRSLLQGLVTGVDGTYSAQVEPGSYRVTAMPTGDRPLPWATQLVPATGVTQAPDLVLADAREVNGTLVYHKANGQAVSVAGATITVYRTPVSSMVQPIKLFEALTDSNGQFKAILPKAPAKAY